MWSNWRKRKIWNWLLDWASGNWLHCSPIEQNVCNISWEYFQFVIKIKDETSNEGIRRSQSWCQLEPFSFKNLIKTFRVVSWIPPTFVKCSFTRSPNPPFCRPILGYHMKLPFHHHRNQKTSQILIDIDLSTSKEWECDRLSRLKIFLAK